MKILLSVLLSLTFLRVSSQDFLGIQTSNYAGVLGIYSNPANIAENRMRFDLVLGGLNFVAENNYVGIKREALEGLYRFDLPSTWDTTRIESPYYQKNNFTTNNRRNNKSVYSATRVVLPSFMICLNRRNSIAFSWGIRNYVNVDGVSPDLAKLAYEEFSYPNLWMRNLSNKKLSVQQMAWAEYGLTYARVLRDKDEHYFKMGTTVKLLQGLEAAYVYIKNLEYNFQTSDTLSLFRSEVAYGHSANLDPLINDLSTGSTEGRDKLKTAYKHLTYPGFGLDLGMVYEWRPDYNSHIYEMDGKKGLWRKDRNKYKLKASFAINDIGGIRFKKGALSNDFIADIKLWDLNSINPNSVNSFDSLMRSVFGARPSETTFKMALPTSINAQVDYQIWKPFYINLMANIANLQPNRKTKVHDFTNISFGPRFDHQWFGVTLPMTFNTLAASRGEPVIFGAMVRLGPLIVGTNDLPAYFTKNVYGANFYFALKVPIPYSAPRDRDHDNVSDKKDICKDIPGLWAFMGCPDRDGDSIPDKDDKCPDVKGIKELQGCPDRDGDGITDLEDACPDDKGLPEFNGCPDTDGDKIIDKEDECPEEAGLKEFNGCPDRDGDGIPDKSDDCPDVFGPLEFKGCPDTDGDGLIDKKDSCVTIAGPIENNGCPWPDTDKDGILDKDDACPTVPGVAQYKGCPPPPPPPPVKAAEIKIIQKAFSSLEFATAKDIIKPKSFPSLNDLAKLMVSHMGDWTLKLSGHTDSEGDDDANMLLSEKRAKAVKAYLVKKYVPAENIITEWFGETMPKADNNTAEGRQKNRRVEMTVQFKEVQQP